LGSKKNPLPICNDGQGFYIKELDKLINKKGLPINFYEFDLISEMYGANISFDDFS
jgi:hypothetical protein